MMTVTLHGSLAELHPHPIKVVANTVYEAVSALKFIPAFDPRSGRTYSVVIDGFDTEQSLHDITDVKEIHLRPVMTGAGGKFGQIIIGAVLIVVGVIVNIVSPGNPIGTALISSGIAMVIGGIIQLLQKQPQPADTTQERSRHLGSNQNTVEIGTPIPLIYGRAKAYGHYLSFDVDARDFEASDEDWYCSIYSEGGVTCAANAFPTPPSDIVQSVKVTSIDYENMKASAVYFSPSVNLKGGRYLVTATHENYTARFYGIIAGAPVLEPRNVIEPDIRGQFNGWADFIPNTTRLTFALQQ